MQSGNAGLGGSWLMIFLGNIQAEEKVPCRISGHGYSDLRAKFWSSIIKRFPYLPALLESMNIRLRSTQTKQFTWLKGGGTTVCACQTLVS